MLGGAKTNKKSSDGTKNPRGINITGKIQKKMNKSIKTDPELLDGGSN